MALGEQTGRMAARILSGEDASTMPVEEVEDATPVYNSEVLEALGLTPAGRLPGRPGRQRGVNAQIYTE